MARSALNLTALACALVSGAASANPSVPHAHKGILTKYESLPPSKYGLSLQGTSTEQLRSGRPVVKFIAGKSSGFKRVVSIQDIKAPEKLVWSVITDLDNYPKMVEGCEMCETYRSTKLSRGGSEVFARYKIGAMGFSLEYFIKHIYEPSKHCLTFHLDYDRCSEISDTVGYWYVEALDDGWCRVYYSTDSQLPSWIPGFAKEGIVNLAAKKATSWVDEYCQIAQGVAPSSKGGPLTKRKLATLALLGWAIRAFARKAGISLPLLALM